MGMRNIKYRLVLAFWKEKRATKREMYIETSTTLSVLYC
jgi:hypothetical protein